MNLQKNWGSLGVQFQHLGRVISMILDGFFVAFKGGLKMQDGKQLPKKHFTRSLPQTC